MPYQTATTPELQFATENANVTIRLTQVAASWRVVLLVHGDHLNFSEYCTCDEHQTKAVIKSLVYGGVILSADEAHLMQTQLKAIMGNSAAPAYRTNTDFDQAR